MTEKIPTRPRLAKDDDFNDLSYDTVMDIFARDDINEEDRKNAEAEIYRREETENLGDENALDPETDLAMRDYIIENGEVYYPTQKAKTFRKENMQGPIPMEWRESLKERARKTVTGLNVNAMDDGELSLSPNDKAELILQRMEKYRLKPFGFRGHTNEGFTDSLLNRCDEYVKNKSLKMRDDKKENLFVRVSEPLMTIILGGAGDNMQKLFSDTAFQTQSRWATKFDDYRNATDIVFSVKDEGSSRLGWITYSVDVTTAIKSDKPNEGVLGKFKESNDKSSAPKSFLGDIDKNGSPRKTLSWVNEIVFCNDPNGKHSEDYAPHFVIGLSRETMPKILDSLAIDEGGFVRDLNLDKDIQFMIASEFFEEIRMQKANFSSEESMQAKKLNPIRIMVVKKLRNLLNIKPGTDTTAFKEQYEKKTLELSEEDKVYAMIMQQAQELRREYVNNHGKTNR